MTVRVVSAQSDETFDQSDERSKRLEFAWM